MNSDIIQKIIENVAYPIIVLLIAAGGAYFLYGVAIYFKDAESVEGRQTGARHMIWGIVGVVIMVSVFGIVDFIKNSISSSVGTPLQTNSVDKLEGFLNK